MKRLIVELAIMVLTGCQAPMDHPICICSDGATTESYGDSCNPLTQTGCNSGEKCNWIFDQVIPKAIGHIGCERNGDVTVGGPCGDRAIGPDPCAKGSECVAGECKLICDHQGGEPHCDSNHACVSQSGFFRDGTTTVAGVCDPACDPLTQALKGGAAQAACGSSVPELPDRGCYGTGQFTCAPVAPTATASDALTLTDRMSPPGDYINACAPGFVPILTAATGSMTKVCSGLCAALEVDNTPGHADNELGNPNALAKNPTEAAPAIGNGTCAAGKRGSTTDGPETCRFLWPYNIDDAGMLRITEYTDTLGVCFPREKYKYDSNGDGMLSALDNNVPPCASLPPRSQATPLKDDDAADFFCQTVAHSMFTTNVGTKGDLIQVGDVVLETSSTRVSQSDGSVQAGRHVFGGQ